MTSQEPTPPHSIDLDTPDTEVIVVSTPAPVFVDSTGRRRRLLRRLSYAFGALCVIYGGLVSVSLAGGPVSSSAVLPLPDLRDDANEAAGPRPTPIPAPPATSRPPEMLVSVLPRRPAPAGVTRVAERRRPVRVAPSPAPAKTPVSKPPISARPVESTTAPSTPATPAPSGSAVTVPPIKVPAPPVPPAPPQSTGGGGGGGAVPEASDETVSAPADPEEDTPATEASTEPSIAESGEADPAEEEDSAGEQAA